MELHELIEAVKAAADKGELEALVLKELGLNLDKRKSLETLRAEVLAGLGVEGGESAPEPAAPASAPSPIPELPELDDEPEPAAPVPKQRLLRRKDNGRLLVWTPALAGLAELEEV